VEEVEVVPNEILLLLLCLLAPGVVVTILGLILEPGVRRWRGPGLPINLLLPLIVPAVFYLVAGACPHAFLRDSFFVLLCVCTLVVAELYPAFRLAAVYSDARVCMTGVGLLCMGITAHAALCLLLSTTTI